MLGQKKAKGESGFFRVKNENLLSCLEKSYTNETKLNFFGIFSKKPFRIRTCLLRG